MKETILIIHLLCTILCTFSCSNNNNLEIQQTSGMHKSKNLSGTFWTSEKLDSSGRFYQYDFHVDGTFSLTSEIPHQGIAILTGNYRAEKNKLYLNDDTLIYKFLNIDTILVEDVHSEKYKLFRNQ
jgi:hypothetical protein